MSILPFDPITPDDPRLTAFALGELDGPDLAGIEAAIAAEPALQSAVADIRAAAERIAAALASEPAVETAPLVLDPPAESPVARRIVRFPHVRLPQRRTSSFPYVWVGAAAAACFAVYFFGVYLPAERERQQVRFVAVDLTGDAFAGASPSGLSLLPDEAEGTTPFRGTGFRNPAVDPISTFPIEAAAAGYATVRRFIEEGRLPPPEEVRIEDMVNRFRYDYPAPAAQDVKPFAASLEIATAPWMPEHRLVRVGLKGRDAGTSGTPPAIAKDVKVQVEFNPAEVQAYRLIGYENRRPAPEDFNNADVGAGEIGAGHAVTAFYEIVPTGTAWLPPSTVDSLRSQPVREATVAGPRSKEMLTVKLRYKAPGGDRSSLLEFSLTDAGAGFAGASTDFKFGAAVAAFGMTLCDSPHRGQTTMRDVLAWAGQGLGDDEDGERAGFISLVQEAAALRGE